MSEWKNPYYDAADGTIDNESTSSDVNGLDFQSDQAYAQNGYASFGMDSPVSNVTPDDWTSNDVQVLEQSWNDILGNVSNAATKAILSVKDVGHSILKTFGADPTGSAKDKQAFWMGASGLFNMYKANQKNKSEADRFGQMMAQRKYEFEEGKRERERERTVVAPKAFSGTVRRGMINTGKA